MLTQCGVGYIIFLYITVLTTDHYTE